MSETVSETASFTHTAGASITVGTGFSVGIPLLVEASVSVEVSASYEFSAGTGRILRKVIYILKCYNLGSHRGYISIVWLQRNIYFPSKSNNLTIPERTDEKQLEAEYNCAAPAGKSVTCAALLFKYKMTVPYTQTWKHKTLGCSCQTQGEFKVCYRNNIAHIIPFQFIMSEN